MRHDMKRQQLEYTILKFSNSFELRVVKVSTLKIDQPKSITRCLTALIYRL